MYTYNHVIYMVLDFLKISSDDAYYTPDHVAFLLTKYRAYVLKSKYENGTDTPSESNYQTLNLEFEDKDAVDGHPCRGHYLVSKNKIPDSIGIGTPTISGSDLFSGDLCVVSNSRFKHVGYNSWMKDIVYATYEGGKVYMKSCNPALYYMQEGMYHGIFSDPLETAALSGEYPVDDDGNLLNPYDAEFPLEDNLLPLVMQYVVKELSGGLYKPKDSENNANDDLSELANFIRTYVKSPLRQQIES
jgi:hypothetical protein